jgi:hypothetical protein
VLLVLSFRLVQSFRDIYLKCPDYPGSDSAARPRRVVFQLAKRHWSIRKLTRTEERRRGASTQLYVLTSASSARSQIGNSPVG